MIVYVDLSAKVEQWTEDSVVAACNGVSRVYLIPGKVKQQLRRWLHKNHRRGSTHYRAFALFVYLAIRDDLSLIEQVVIDRDYSGSEAEATIKNFLLSFLRMHRPSVTAGFIQFENVAGRRADLFARDCFQGKREPDAVVQYEELEAILRK